MLANALELRAECVRKNVTLANLATKIGVNEATLHRKIKGDSDFSRNELQIIRSVLGLNNKKFLDIFFNE